MADARPRRRTIGATAAHAATHDNRCPGLPGPTLPCTGSVPQRRRARRGARGLHRKQYESCTQSTHSISQHSTPLAGRQQARTRLPDRHGRRTRRMALYRLRNTAYDRTNAANRCSYVFFAPAQISLASGVRRLQAYYFFLGRASHATSNAHARTRARRTVSAGFPALSHWHAVSRLTC